MSDDVQTLIDRLAIRDVLASYYRAIDRRDWDALTGVYADDARFRSPPRLEQNGRDTIIASTSRVAVYKRTYHFMGNHIAWVDGDDADAETYAVARHYYDKDGEEQEYVIGIRYLDKLQRRDGQWLIVDRLMRYDFLRGESLLHPGTKVG